MDESSKQLPSEEVQRRLSRQITLPNPSLSKIKNEMTEPTEGVEEEDEYGELAGLDKDAVLEVVQEELKKLPSFMHQFKEHF